MPKPCRIILDVDTGIDDAMAILYALGRQGVVLEAVTTSYGNVDCLSATRNTLQVLDIAGRPDVPVAMGALRALTTPFRDIGSRIHGRNGMGEVDLPPPSRAPAGIWGPDLMIELVRAHPGEITIVPVGPMTNVAQALMKAPDLAQKVAGIVPMGGALRHPGVPRIPSPWADANFYQDPEAARILFQSGAPITVVGMDVTMKTRLTAVMMDEIGRRGGPAARAVMQAAGFYLAAYQEQYPGISFCALHDPLAVEVALDPAIVTTEAMELDIECHGEITRGQLIADLRDTGHKKTNALVALQVDAPRFEVLFAETLIGLR